MLKRRSSKSSALHLTTALALTLSAGTVISTESFAQSTTSAEGATEVVVTGTRTPRRSRLDTLAPVDVIKSDTLTSQGSPELAEGLSKVAPSITFPRPAVTDGTDSVRPATLRGLSPDQTLVLVNGKRRHTSALVNINGSVGRGSAAADLNTIPETALSSVEVLRDGASAQYGSDAIAGVVNLRLREANHGGGTSVSYGQYDTDVKTASTSYHKADGGTATVSGWVGLPLGADGFLTLSGEVKDRHPTNRAGLDYRITPAAVKARYGDPAERSSTFFANAGKPINDVWSAYGFASVQSRYDQSAANYRQPGNTGNVLAVYPDGFLPMIDVRTKDYSLTGGLKGALFGWDTDFSLSNGDNRLYYYTTHSINATFGAASKTGFYSGSLDYSQIVFDANFSKAFAVGLAAPLDVAFGLEARQEHYQIEAGEYQSYATGTAGASSTTPASAQGFPGLFPSNITDKSRRNIGIYVDVETKLTEKLSVAAAVRGEDYSDFGSNTSGKLSARYDFTPSFALRGSASTGFRAPSLQQQYFTSSATNFINGQPYLVTTFPATSGVAKALGAAPLKPEKSENLAFGGVFHRGPFELTIDGYQIKIKDRIVLSENLVVSSSATGQAIAALLAPYSGVGGARFFMNGVDTTTKGIDVVAHYRLPAGVYGMYDFGIAANHGETKIDRYPTNNVLSTLASPPALFARVNQNLMADSTPKDKVTASLDWSLGKWTASASAIYYSSVFVAASTSTAIYDYETGNKTLVNLSGSYKLPYKITWSVGIDNVGDVYPNKVPLATLAQGATSYNAAAAFSARSPFGFNGRYIYTRFSKAW